MFDSIINRGEYYSNHYLDVLIQNDLAGLRTSWEEAERRGEPTGRTRLRGLSRPYFATKTRTAQHSDPDQLRALHDLILAALGFRPARTDLTMTRASTEISVPVAATVTTRTGLLLVALDAGMATDVDEALDTDPHGPGALLAPIGADRPARERISGATDAASMLFACDDPPRYTLILAGGIVLLADRTAWAEGRFLAVDLDLALSRGDTKAKGELETIAALFSADSLVPTEGPSVADNLAAASQKHAVGVSKELRDGIRLSIELLANEVISQRLATNQAVYNVEGLARDLTRQCLRFLYRLLFLLYAESRPELGIVPKDHPEYDEGYGLERLRDLALTSLTNDRARDGSHLHESLKLLFRLVNDGHGHAQVAQSLLATSDGIALRFEPLRSELFDPKATPLLDRVKLRNHVLQQVLRLLMLSRETKGKARGFVSYANLGINQLGAVYEGLMAYTGFFAADDLYEVSTPGAADKGTWVVRVRDAGDLPDEVFVTRPQPETGFPTRVLHPKGSFVFRLSGRDRQRSASYYTPEILTRCVVRHALAELLDQDGQTTPAAKLLELTICEPALGSGAFLNEAINQLAAEYLHRRQAELGQTIDPEQYATEQQKVKAHLALHQCYGVDLNATAVELAEVSLWLNSTYPGLQAPWFGMHLRRGNSLIGARRATYPRTKLARAAWLTEVPTDRKLVDGPIAANEIHHFLLPAQGWAVVADAKQAKELRPEETARLKTWRTTIRRSPSDNDSKRLLGLAQRVETLWTQATQRLRLAERDLRRSIDIWGTEAKGAPSAYRSREAIDELVRDPASPLGRLRLVMDAWCALWFWPVDGPEGMARPPSLVEWLDVLEGILGIQPAEAPLGQLALFDPADLDALVERDRQLQFEFGMRSVDDVIANHPWLHVVRDIADREGFWHWELEFAPMFEAGGFDLLVGNPPWVRREWSQQEVLCEFDARFVFASDAEVTAGQVQALNPTDNEKYLEALCSHTGEVAALTAPVNWPLLEGLHSNLYRVFIDQCRRLRDTSGITGLLHPDSHFVDSRAATLRQWCFGSLRRCWRFINQLLLFEEIGNTRPFAVNVYGAPQDARFLMACNIYHPDTVDASFDHDGSGDPPGLKTARGGWDLSPHRKRLITVDEGVLGDWRTLFADKVDGRLISRLPQVQSSDDLVVIHKFQSIPTRIGDLRHIVDGGLKETASLRAGTIQRDCFSPKNSHDQVFQNPHFTICNPYSQDANPGCKNHRDYFSLSTAELPTEFSHRSGFRLNCSRDDLTRVVPAWLGKPAFEHWRLVYKRRADTQGSRTLQACLLFPGPIYVDATHSLLLESLNDLVLFCGLWASLPYDYFTRVIGKSDLFDDVISLFPVPNVGDEIRSWITLRTLRLNCLTGDYAEVWSQLFAPHWQADSWTMACPEALGVVSADWSGDTPLRTERARRQALIELDVLGAMALGLSPTELVSIYKSQFGIIRAADQRVFFDPDGSAVDGSPSADDHTAPLYRADREREWSNAFAEFDRRLNSVELHS
jgi:hypothetical protein